MDSPKQITYNISTLSILKVVLVFLILAFLWLVRDILAILFVSLIFASAVDTWIDKLQRYRIPRAIGILLIYIIALGILSGVIILIIPAISGQVLEIAKRFPTYYDKVVTGFVSLREYSDAHGFDADIQQGLQHLNSKITSNIGSVFTTITSIFGGIVSFFVVLVITFYMVVQENAIKKIVRQVAPDRYQPYISQVINRIQRKVGAWLQGQLILCVFVGLITFIGLSILRVKYALILSLIAGVMEFVPFLGPILGAIPAVFLVFFQSPIKALLVIGLYILIQQIENNILVPKVMQKAVGLNPIISITVLMIGAKVAGIVGALLAIPVATALSVVVKDFFDVKNEGEV